MTWVFHDSFKTQKSAEKAGTDILKVGLAAGAKVTKLGKKAKPFMLYILPLKERREK